MTKYNYDIVAIGGGAAGLVSAKMAAKIGKRTAIIEKDKLGGECTWHGCVPSKTLIRVGKAIKEASSLSNFGINAELKVNDTSSIMNHVKSIVGKIYDTHKPEDLKREGIDIIFGSPRFIDNNRVEIDDRVISSRRFIICTGSSALIPPIKGLERVAYLTNESFFALKDLPSSILIIGAGNIGVELAQALNRTGSQVHLVEMMDQILINEDKELSQGLERILTAEGLKYTKILA